MLIRSYSLNVYTDTRHNVSFNYEYTFLYSVFVPLCCKPNICYLPRVLIVNALQIVYGVSNGLKRLFCFALRRTKCTSFEVDAIHRLQ